MIETDVHNKIIAYDDTNIHANHFIAYLKSNEMKDKVEEYCNQAKKSFDFSFDIKSNHGYDYILKFVGENKYNLKLK